MKTKKKTKTKNNEIIKKVNQKKANEPVKIKILQIKLDKTPMIRHPERSETKSKNLKINDKMRHETIPLVQKKHQTYYHKKLDNHENLTNEKKQMSLL